MLTSYNLGLALAAVPAAYAARRRPVAPSWWGRSCSRPRRSPAGSRRRSGARGRTLHPGGRWGAAGLRRARPADRDRGLRRPRRAPWASAGVLGAALGPAAGGILTETLGWESIFLVQAPLALVTLLGVVRLPSGRSSSRRDGRACPRTPRCCSSRERSRALPARAPARRRLAHAARRRRRVVTVMPVAAIATAAFADRVGSTVVRAASGVILVAGARRARRAAGLELGMDRCCRRCWSVPASGSPSPARPAAAGRSTGDPRRLDDRLRGAGVVVGLYSGACVHQCARPQRRTARSARARPPCSTAASRRSTSLRGRAGRPRHRPRRGSRGSGRTRGVRRPRTSRSIGDSRSASSPSSIAPSPPPILALISCSRRSSRSPRSSRSQSRAER